MALTYLTVQDMLWINLEVTGQVNRWDYDRLEEATFYQYGYGRSTDLVGQAERLVRGFARLEPFTDGNLASGLVALATFLGANGVRLNIEPSGAAQWVMGLAGGDDPGLAGRVGEHESNEGELQEIARAEIARYRAAIDELNRAEAAARI